MPEPCRLVVFTACDDAYRTAIDLAGAGVDVQMVVDVRKDPQGSLIKRTRELGIEIRDNAAVIGTEGDADGVLTAVRVASLDGGVPEAIACDCLAVSGGWDPLFDLHLHVSGGSRWNRKLVGFVPDGSLPGIRVTGSAAGIFGTAGCW